MHAYISVRNSGDSPQHSLLARVSPRLSLLLLLHCSYTTSSSPTLHSLVTVAVLYFIFQVDMSLAFL